MHRHLQSIFARLIAVALTLAASEALAQGVTGSAINGVVTRAAGGGTVEGASVQLRNTATGETFTATSGKDGKYFIDNVPPGGPYTLVATAEGFQPAAMEDLTLTLGQRMTLDVPMKKELVEEMTVVARRDRNADKNRTGPSSVVKSTTITAMPLQGRNFTDLLSTDPRISGSSVAGQNNRFNNIQIDGGANNDLFGLAGNGTPGGQANAKPLSIEAIQEFTINIAPFDVRQGMFAGGLVNAVTKSGTNEFHGDVFGYFQNKSLASGKAYINGNYITDPNFLDYNTIQYGATLGGPIIKDKLHFFAAVDLQTRSSSFGNQFQMSGDDASDVGRVGFTNAQAQKFIDILKNKYNVPDPGNVLAPSLGNPDHNVFVKLTSSAIPDSHLEVSYNLVNATQDVLTRAPLTSENFNNGGLRDGYQLSNAGYDIGNWTNTGRVKLTTNFLEGKVSNELLGGFSIIRDKREIPANIPLILVKLGDPTNKTPNPDIGPGVGSSPGWIAAGGERFSQANILNQDIWQLQDNVTIAQDNHRLTLGTSNEFFRFKNVFLQAATGVWAFNSLADLDAGTPAAFQRRFGVGNVDPGTAKFGVQQWGFYAQDEYSPAENVSFTMGLRMDVPFLSTADVNPDVLNTSPLHIDTGKVPSGNPLWSPRVGFNWDVTGDSNTVVRGGVGVFTGRPPYVWVSNAYTINGISQTELDCTAATGLPAFTVDPNAQPTTCKGGAATPPAAQPNSEIDYFDPNTKYPQNLRVAAGADQRLPWGIVATGDFLYTQDVNGWYTSDQNLNFQGYDGDGRAMYGVLGNTTTSTGAPALRSTPSRIDSKVVGPAIEVWNKNGGKVYSATLQLQKAIGRRYGVSVAYTYSRSYDRISLTSSQAFSNFRFAPVDGDLDNRNIRPSAFDRPHKLTITGTAALPYGFGVALSYVGQSGLPYTWVVTGDVNGDGVNGNDVAFIPASASQISLAPGSSYQDLAKFIDSQQCLKDAKGGLIQRGACRNPWQDFMDMRVSWTSPNWNGQRLEVQYDIFNVLNLINSQWGHFDQVAPFETAPSNFLSAVGYDAANKRPIYSFKAPPTIVTPVYSPTLSRWRMQIGARYLF